MNVFEFGESGHTIEFPMSDKEIEKAKVQRRKIKRFHPKEVDTNIEIIEMADGHTITFKKSE